MCKIKSNAYIPLSEPSFRGNEIKYVTECLETGWVSSAGQYVNQFEKNFAKYVQAKNAVACINGTAALHIALIIAGIKSDHEVIVPTLSFIAPINAVRYVGAEPVFMDCDSHLTMDVQKLTEFIENECDYLDGKLINRQSRAQIRAILPVHIFGVPVNIEPIMKLAKKYELVVIEDSAESLGSYYGTGNYSGQQTGTIGDIGCFSFNGNKIITSGGGGMIVTRHEDLAVKARYLIDQAKDDKGKSIHNEIGYNYRISNLHAALGCAQLERLEEYLRIKRDNVNWYRNHIDPIPGITLIDEPEYGVSNYWYNTILINEKEYGMSRDNLLERFSEKNIESRPIWHLCHLQKSYRDCQAHDIKKACEFANHAMNIPSSVSLCEEDRIRVIEVLKNG